MQYSKFLSIQKWLAYLPVLFVIVIIPMTYWFEIFVVLPSLYPSEEHPGKYWGLFAFGHFLLLNIVGNLMGIVVTDTSVENRKMPNLDSPDAAGYCDECQCVTPRRSYHCPACNVCILRRDHHCMFTGCCIGFNNHRYFLMFLFHVFVATAFCLPFNIAFLWDSLTWMTFLTIGKMMAPLIFLFQPTFTTEDGYILVCAISVSALILVGIWTYFHLSLTLKGRLVHEMRKDIALYDKGTVENLREVLGEKWRIVWLSPFIQSKQPGDGIHFETKTHSN